MTPTQQRVLAYLAGKSPAWVGGYELRDECVPGRDVKNVHVHIHMLRRQGASIQSNPGPRGGYRVTS